MNQTEFSAEEDEFEYRGYTYNAGDSGSLFLCQMVAIQPFFVR